MPSFKENRCDWTIQWIAIALLFVFAVGQLLLALDRSPSSDDALFLSVPKNWINGYGWATSYSEKIPFNPDFTGPAALLLPAALLIKVFGTQWWIAGITGWVVNLLLSILCLWQIRFYGKNPALNMLCLACGIIAGFPLDFSSLIGYYTGSLLFLLAVCVAFNPSYSTYKRAMWVGAMCGISLLIKPLLIPAFIGLSALFFLTVFFKKIPRNTLEAGKNTRKTLIAIAIALIMPALLISQFNSWLQSDAIKNRSQHYQESYQEYKQDFIHHHGSGIGQWLEAKEKLPYIFRNANKNLYFVEEGLSAFGIKNPFLGDDPADVNHIVGFLYLIILSLLVFLSIKNIATVTNPSSTILVIFSISACTLVYMLWFVLFAMAMSPGHLYFSMQWTLWLIFLLPVLHGKKIATFSKAAMSLVALILSILVITNTENRNTVFFQSRTSINNTSSLEQAIRHIKASSYPLPLAGCGYNGYPRHLEYRLETSQNFSDCLDLIEDHVVKQQQHYQWKSPLAFTLVISLQSISFAPEVSQVNQACMNNILYRNNDIFILQCDFEDLKTLNLDTLMPAIQASHQWYKTRIQ